MPVSSQVGASQASIDKKGRIDKLQTPSKKIYEHCSRRTVEREILILILSPQTSTLAILHPTTESPPSPRLSLDQLIQLPNLRPAAQPTHLQNAYPAHLPTRIPDNHGFPIVRPKACHLIASSGHIAPCPKRMIRNGLHLLKAPQHRRQQDCEEEQDPSCHAREARVVDAASAHVGAARVVRFHDQAAAFSDGEDGEESTAPAKTMGITYGVGLPANETV